MRWLDLIIMTFVVKLAMATSMERSPFLPPYYEASFENIHDRLNDLRKRQGTCPSGANICSNLGDAGACCTGNTNCQRDQQGHVACCPNGASCTGVINTGVASTTSGPSTASSIQMTTSTSNAFIMPSSTNAGANPQATPAGASTIPNAFFPFVVAPVSYSNGAACSSYYSSCQNEYNSCTASLGGANGVTVGGPGGGTTVQGATATLAPGQAQSVCSSLSSQACSGAQLSNCATYGSASATGPTLINPNAAPTGCAGGLYGLGMGFALGIAGQVLM